MKEFLKNTLLTYLVVGMITLPGCRNRNTESETTVDKPHLHPKPTQESELAKSFKETLWFSSVEPEKQKQLLIAADQFEAKSNQEGWVILRPDENNILKTSKISEVSSQETFSISTVHKDSDKKETHLVFRSSPIDQQGFNAESNKLKILISIFLVDGVYKDFITSGIPFKKLVPKGNTTFELDLSLTDEKLIEKQIADQMLKLNAAVARVSERAIGFKSNKLSDDLFGNTLMFMLIGSVVYAILMDATTIDKRLPKLKYVFNFGTTVLVMLFIILVVQFSQKNPASQIDVEVK